ncbi:unnamed protein product [Linum tenue]|uniref:Protein FAR1-RELATED SEQUENCE n=1 Tax=Linum tenue TaxID=586396 RepID=A0AAV0JAV0_9ROSI|nr:unnamed protein product [Linum tenue]
MNIKELEATHTQAKDIRSLLNMKYDAHHNMTHIYNETTKIRRERLGGLKPMRWTLIEAQRLGYFIECEFDDQRRVTRLFLCHPESIRMLLAWYFVVLIDSTYKTNKYKQPLVHLRGEWLPCRERWANCYTNRIFHIGNTSTNRVESMHSSLKKWLATSTHKIDTLFLRFHTSVNGRVIELRKDLEDSLSKVFSFLLIYEVYMTPPDVFSAQIL